MQLSTINYQLSNIVINLFLQKGKHIHFRVGILKYRILMVSLSFSIILLFYPHQKNERRYVQNQTQNENSLMGPEFYLNFLTKHAKWFLKRWMFTQSFQGSHFSFPCKCIDQVTPNEGMYSWNALGKITSKLVGNR